MRGCGGRESGRRAGRSTAGSLCRLWQVRALVLHHPLVFLAVLAWAADPVARPGGEEVALAAQAPADSSLGMVVVAVAPWHVEPAGLHRDGDGSAAEPLGNLLVGKVAHPHLHEDALLLEAPQALAHGAAADLGGGRAHHRRTGPGGSADPGPAVDDAPLAEGPNRSFRAGGVRGAVAERQGELGGLRRDRVRRAFEPLGYLLAGAVRKPHLGEDVLVPEGPANQPLWAMGLLAAGGWVVS